MEKETKNSFERMSDDFDERELIQALYNLPEQAPPYPMRDRILSNLQPKRISWWRRLRFQALAPRCVTFSPLRAALGTTAAIVLLVALWPARDIQYRQEIARENTAKEVPVTFVLPDPEARIQSAAIIGSFNQWNPKGYEMSYSSERKAWVCQTKLRAGTHEYVFIVDGSKKIPDPAVPFVEQDGFGNRNTVLLLPEDYEIIETRSL
ncbi:glycogen-binding domain-containing protein [Desulfoferrobacter suflitae]|uniref:glycogen-binding domain-containing protein n=1 Tax=Desulfoferrobacter suflitae TaxID=2865782 RepID=UPI0021642805|nr:glycogen-binding domain-containing protein [Desulfoferrobacter suflitae]MCK8604187.1 glycogen-binding domain-containing protein [Desulfoferrobacter suflitae]